MKARRPLRPTRIPTPKPDPKEAARKTAQAAAAEDAAKKARAKEAEKEAAKKAKEREQADKLAKAEAKLAPIAHEINVRMEKAAMMDGKADDHRLAAALKFADAKKLCEDAGIKFEEWSKKHVPNQSFETVRQLARVGAADDPKIALADLRKGNAERNRQHRAKAKKAVKGGNALPSAPAARAATPFQRAEAALAEMPETAVKELVSSQAGQLGMQVVSDKELKELRNTTGTGAVLTLDAMKRGFKALQPGDRLKLVSFIEDETGYRMITEEEFKIVVKARSVAKKPGE